jgi:hypothetical protein
VCVVFSWLVELACKMLDSFSFGRVIGFLFLRGVECWVASFPRVSVERGSCFETRSISFSFLSMPLAIGTSVS